MKTSPKERNPKGKIFAIIFLIRFSTKSRPYFFRIITVFLRIPNSWFVRICSSDSFAFVKPFKPTLLHDIL
jgi:hypothetical protein